MDNKKSRDRMLRSVLWGKGVPKSAFVLFLLLYFLASIVVVKLAGTGMNTILFAGMEVPVTAFVGVFSSLANICLITLVVFYKRAGFYTTLGILLIQYPIMILNITARHNYVSLPGLFSNAFTIAACVLIFFNFKRIDKYQKRMHDQAVTDVLTGIPNRFAASELSKDLIRKGKRFAIVCADLNNFKSINDTMGHEVGDKVLIEIANRWKALSDSGQTKTIDFVSHLGGDEYELILWAYESEMALGDAIDAYRSELERVITIDDVDYYMTACFGYAQYPTDAPKSEGIVSCAEVALHEAKKQRGNNAVLRFAPELLQTEKTLEIERKIRAALEKDTVFFHLQPQFDMNNKLRGFEALARMKDEDGSFIPPVDFIPVAEKTGLIDRIDLCVFKQSAAFLSEVLAKGDTDITVSINVSVKHLMKNNFIEELKGVLNEYHIPAKNLEIEITESVMIDSVEKALECINEVKEMGVQVAIDDFGTGYSSLSYLNSFPANLLKIDKSFIDVMNSGESTRKYVASIISIGHVLNMKVISEGVESEDQLATLREVGCDYIQGFLWGRPLPPEEAAKLIP